MENTAFAETGVANDSNSSGVSWGAVIAGAFVAAALSLALLALGTGIGFSTVSPWANSGASAARIGGAAIVWLVLMQLVSSSMGGYLAGRLRTKWVHVHTHEVYFRDTAHGFLVWAVGLVITAAFLTSAVASLVGGSARVGAREAEMSGQAQSDSGSGQNAYFVDALLRPTAPNASQDNASVRAEVGVILANGLREGRMPQVDMTYLAEVVAAGTGLTEPDARSE